MRGKTKVRSKRKLLEWISKVENPAVFSEKSYPAPVAGRRTFQVHAVTWK